MFGVVFLQSRVFKSRVFEIACVCKIACFGQGCGHLLQLLFLVLVCLLLCVLVRCLSSFWFSGDWFFDALDDYVFGGLVAPEVEPCVFLVFWPCF